MNELRSVLAATRAANEPIVFLTGAGISAESGIPTFRGPEGYWQVGSDNYRPEQLATFAAFSRMPEAIWAWYLYRRSVCRTATPNAAHDALAQLEQGLPDRFHLVTQNVDGLHLRAGNSRAKTFEIHGNIDFVRCAAECQGPERILPMPTAVPCTWDKGQALDRETAIHLRCDDCAGWLRPNVLWFDECYDEARFRVDSSQALAENCAALIVIGTSGATTLPAHMVQTCYQRGAQLIVVGPDPSPFSAMAEQTAQGTVLWGQAGTLVPSIAGALLAD